ncbi:hypothetical protein NMN56_042375 [Streptomyces iconiensis]|uniref:Chemotaxis protein n=2 Tax=Streptomyces iconiensis TaxID=1384038 RepID=A0ABT7AD13_9ACTN|nr:hypothetical protein [Streptomyces iconiensis]MDJ1138493.1 hypothetical protein [Streptomyces iconiensis]
MRTNDLTNTVLAELREPRSYPAVTLVVPTHRTRPDRDQDPVRLRNVIAEASRRLSEDSGVPERVRQDVVGQLEQAEAETDLVYALDTLVVFAAPGEHQLWYLPRPASGERITISDTFLTRNLVAAKAQSRPYWVLTFSEERARLWSGSGEQLVEERREGFPIEQDKELPERQRIPRTGDYPSGYRDEAALQHLRAVDADLFKVLENEPRPLLVAGLPQGISALEDVGTHAARKALAYVPKGGLTDASASVVYEAIAPAREKLVRARAEGAVERLGNARGRKEFVAGLDEVWNAAQEGRLALLVVEEPYRQTARLTSGHLTPVPDDAADDDSGEVRDDIVDETVEAALSTEAEVVFVPDGALAEHGRIAGAVRYTWART